MMATGACASTSDVLSGSALSVVELVRLAGCLGRVWSLEENSVCMLSFKMASTVCQHCYLGPLVVQSLGYVHYQQGVVITDGCEGAAMLLLRCWRHHLARAH